MYKNIGPAAPAPSTNLGNFKNTYYWSSSEASSNLAYSIGFFITDTSQVPGWFAIDPVGERFFSYFNDQGEPILGLQKGDRLWDISSDKDKILVPGLIGQKRASYLVRAVRSF